MNKFNSISAPVIRRLPRYYRFLGELKEKGVTRVSSKELSDKMGFTASLIRQDLNCFGGFGQQGYGYSVDSLYNEIGQILGLEHSYNAILLGAGNLGRAVATHMSFEKRGFRLTGIFDIDEGKVGEKFCFENHTDAAILCVPKSAAPELSEKLYQIGIRNYWNFSHYDLSVYHDDIIVENVHLNDSLMILCYRISAGEGEKL